MRLKLVIALALLLAALATWGTIHQFRAARAAHEARLAAEKAAAKAAKRAANLAARREYLGKPIDINGTLLDGSPFSTTSLKGKVVLVHFWASWCPDCQAELPSVLKLHADYRDKGLEIVGISSDVTAPDLRNFLDIRKDISWRQLYTPPLENGRHPLNTTFHVDWIPTVFIIDRQGICRSVEGDQEMTDLVPKLLAEPTPANGN